MKALALSDGEGPFRAAGSKGYLLARDIYLYARRPEGIDLEPAVRRFLRFALSEEGQRIAEAIGYDRVPVAQATAQRTALE